MDAGKDKRREVVSLDLKKMEQQIEQERRILNQMAAEHGICDHRVIDQSEQLDRIMDSYLYHKQLKNRKLSRDLNDNCFPQTPLEG